MVVSAALLGGCGIPAQPPGLLVATAPPGAACTLARDGRTVAAVGPTPAIARGLDRGSGVVTVTCVRPGFAAARIAVPGPYPERVDIALAPTAAR